MAFKPIRRPVGTGLKKPLSKPVVKPKIGASSGFGEPSAKAKPKPGGAFAKAAVEQTKYEERRNMPFRCSVPVGGSREIYFLDKGEPWTRYEHNIGGGPNSRGEIYACIKDGNENCPACAKENKEGAFVMFLTSVTPLEKYEKKDGTVVTRRWSKQLFPIKIKMSKKYQRLYEAHGTFRGMVVKVHRDQKMDAGTGSDVEFVRMMSEAEIQKIAKTVPGIKKDEERKRALDSKLADAFDYEKIMPTPSAKKLAAMIHATGNVVGSSDFSDEESGEFDGATGWGSDDED